PVAVAAEVAVAGVAEAAGVRVDDAEDGQAPVGLADDAAGQGLRLAVEADVGDAGVGQGAGGGGPPDDRRRGVSEAQQPPARLVLPALAAVLGELLERRAADAVSQQDPLQRGVGDGAGRLSRLRRTRPGPAGRRRQGPGETEQRALEVVEKSAGSP